MELKKDTYLVDDIIIETWQVISRMDKAAEMNMLDPFKLPFFDYEKFPFLMVRDTYSNFYLANVREFTTQVLVRTSQKRQGFCIQMGKDGFDFHFTTVEEESKTETVSTILFANLIHCLGCRCQEGRGQEGGGQEGRSQEGKGQEGRDQERRGQEGGVQGGCQERR